MFRGHVDAVIGYNHFISEKEKLPCFFAIVTESEGTFFCACPGSHHLVQYSNHVGERLLSTLIMVEVSFFPSALYTGHDYLHYAGGK